MNNDKFTEIADAINRNFQEMVSEGRLIFKTSLDANVGRLYIPYLDAFGGILPTDKRMIWRVNNVHACKKCAHFINHYGTLVGINPETLEIRTLFDGLQSLIEGTEYERPINTINELIHEKSTISIPYFPTEGYLKRGDSDITVFGKKKYRIGTKAEPLQSSIGLERFNHYVGGAEALAKKVAFDDKGELVTVGDPVPAIVKRDPQEEYVFNHMYLDVPEALVRPGDDAGDYTNDINLFQKNWRDNLRRIFEEGIISKEAFETAIPLFEKYEDEEKTILKDEDEILAKPENQWLAKLGVDLYNEFESIPKEKRELWYSCKAYQLAFVKVKGEDGMYHSQRQFVEISNSGGGPLVQRFLIPFTEGKKDLYQCMGSYNHEVDPANYGENNSETPPTAAQVESMKRAIKKYGYEESLKRCYATPDHLRLASVNFYDGTNQSVSQTEQDGQVAWIGQVFQEMDAASTPGGFIKESQFAGIQEIPIEGFIKGILPKAVGAQILLQSKHMDNRAVLTCAQDLNTLPLTSYGNSFEVITFEGLAGKSRLKSAVAGSGSFADAWFSTSLLWYDDVDLDLHMKEKKPGYLHDIFWNSGNRVDSVSVSGYGAYRDTVKRLKDDPEKLREFIEKAYAKTRLSGCSGCLDQDIITHPHGELAVENIFYLHQNTIPDGTYTAYVHAYSGSCNFKAQVTFGHECREYSWSGEWETGDKIPIAQIEVKHGQVVSWLDGVSLGSRVCTPEEVVIAEDDREMGGGLCAGQFYPIELACTTPESWGKTNPVGTQYFFAIKNFRCDQRIRAYVPSHLSPEFLKRVGKKAGKVLATMPSMQLNPDPEQPQLAGLIFNPQAKDAAIVKIITTDGSEKVYRVLFGGK